MANTDAYIYIIIGILGVAYPVLLQVVARLDEKYSSDKIVELFDQEWENKAFRYSLITSLVFIVIWSLKLPPLIHIDGFDFLIENSASLLLSINSILLVVFFFFFVNKILVYYTPTKFIPYLIKRNDKVENNYHYFIALSELLLVFIKQQQTSYSKTLSDFFYSAFRKIREKYTNQPVVYPDLYYEVVYKSIEELAILKEKRNHLLEHRTSGEVWLLGELPGNEISDTTFSWMWRNLLLAIRYQQDDLILYHWETCHQYYVYSLRLIHLKYDKTTGDFQVSNQEAVDKRLAERQKFIEFHYALGGLLTYKERYDCIKRMFHHTQSHPPKYELLPESMYEIFKFYFDIRDPYERKYPWISSQYPFPKLSGLNADYAIKRWIMSYMAILFLRQYTIVPYLITMKPFAFPRTPDTQGEIKQWIEGLDLFKKLVSKHLQNGELLSVLNLDFLTVEWCAQHDKPYPITFIEHFKSKLEAEYHDNALNLPISNEKVTQFETSTQTIIESAIDKMQLLNNDTTIPDDDCDKWYVNGQRILQDKDDFSETPEAHHVNSDTFLASLVSEKLDGGLAETFFYKQTKSFLLDPKDIFKAIDRLGIDDSFVIVYFGVNLDSFIDDRNISGLSPDKYKNISIHTFLGSQIVRDSIFILKKQDLPNISTIPIEPDIIEKYSLKKISDSLNLYASIINMNKVSEEIFNENNHEISDDQLRKSVLLSIFISTEYKWKKNMKIIQLKINSEYLQRGIVNNLEGVQPFESY